MGIHDACPCHEEAYRICGCNEEEINPLETLDLIQCPECESMIESWRLDFAEREITNPLTVRDANEIGDDKWSDFHNLIHVPREF